MEIKIIKLSTKGQLTIPKEFREKLNLRAGDEVIIYFKDGGTILYIGLGYKIIKWHRLSQRIIDNKEIEGYDIGYEIFYFLNKNFFLSNDIEPKIKLKFIAK